MLKLEVLVTVYNKGANLCAVCHCSKQHRLHLSYNAFLCGCRLQCVCLPHVERCSTAVHSVMLSLVGIANCVVESCPVILNS